MANFYESGAGNIVLQAFVATAAVFLSITAFIMITKKDFSFLYSFLSAAFIVLVVLSLLNFVIMRPRGNTSRTFSFGISVLGLVEKSLVLRFSTTVT